MNYSKFGEKFTRPNAITQLMEDLGKANQGKNPDLVMLGGGNPAIIPQAQAVFVKELQQIVTGEQTEQMLGLYDGPQGNEQFIKSLVRMLNETYGWSLIAANVALTNGSQNSFFSLFNLFAGEMPDGRVKKVLFPLVPEYVGYADQGLIDNMFISVKPEIHMLEQQQFKYQIDFNAVASLLQKRSEEIGVICLSRPTNPTGNVVTDTELAQLDKLAQQYRIPLIVDNAYGHPFPGVIYTDAQLTWNANTILCMSISKLGLPGLRTGIVIANEQTIQAMSRIAGIMTLAPNSAGATLLTRLLEEQRILPLCEQVIKPYYQEKAAIAVKLFNEIFAGLPVYLHKLEGAFFMWLWFRDMGVSSDQLYADLKKQGVYVIPGHDAFMGVDSRWAHQYQCVRINYAKEEAVLLRGLQAIKVYLESTP